MADVDLEKLQSQKASILDSLSESSSARTGSQTPSLTDISNQQRLSTTEAKIRTAQNKQIQERWYGKDSFDKEGREGSSPGFLSRTLDFALNPLYALVGTVDYATGQADGKSLYESAIENVTTNKRTFANLLEDAGVARGVAAPAGLFLDIAGDPLAWLTFGTSAIIPRIFYGLGKGTARGGVAKGLQAAGKGISSKTYAGLEMSGRFAGATSKIPGWMTGKVRNTYSKVTKKELPIKVIKPEAATGKAGKKVKQSFTEKMSTKAGKASDEYYNLVGRDLIELVTKASPFRARMADLAEVISKDSPFMRTFFEYFHYDNAGWMRQAQIMDALTQVVGSDKDAMIGIRAYLRSLRDNIPYKEAEIIAIKEARILEKMSAGRTQQTKVDWTTVSDSAASRSSALTKKTDDVDDLLETLRKESRDASEITTNPGKFVTDDPFENVLRLAEEGVGKGKFAMDDLEKLARRGNRDTGWKWFDKKKNDALKAQYEVKFGKHSKKAGDLVGSFIAQMERFITLFKRGKVGGAGTAWTNAVVGNLVMAMMGGINVIDPKYLARVTGSAKLMLKMNVKEKFLMDILHSKTVREGFENTPNLIANTTGMTSPFLTERMFIERVKRTARETGMITDATNIPEFERTFGYINDDLRKVQEAFRKTYKGGKLSPEDMKAIEKMSVDLPENRAAAAAMKGETPNFGTDPTSLAGSEFYNSELANEFLRMIARKAKAGNPIYKALNLTLNKMSHGYERIDQTYKFGNFLYTAIDGVPEASLRIISRNIVLRPEDITKVGHRYRLSSVKSLELANEIYLNYAAMPAAIKVLRALPLIGFPFASFSYGMAHKTLRTIRSNPAAFNKISLAQKDLSGSKSPVEKGVLSDPRFDYLNEPGMFKIPGLQVSSGVGPDRFFEKYGLYVNTAQMVPYLTLNMLETGKRKYEGIWPSRVVSMIDQSPFFKGPVGGAMMDYLVLPTILQQERALGQFGQPLYPLDASPIEKLRRFTYQGIIDPITPGIFGAGVGALYGLANKAGIAPAAGLDFIPTYRGRKIGFGLRGESPLGISGKESVGSRTTRAILGAVGFPVQNPVPFTYIPKNLKELLEKQSK